MEELRLIDFIEVKPSGDFIKREACKRKAQSRSLKLFGAVIKLEEEPPLKRARMPEAFGDLPSMYRDFLHAKGASDVKLIMERRLTATDMNPNQNRLSMPSKKVKDRFLTEEEETLIGESRAAGRSKVMKKLEVTVIDPSLQMRAMKFTRWNGQKMNGWWYALIHDWNKLARDNGFAVEDPIQVWSFRIDGALGFIIHRVQQ